MHIILYTSIPVINKLFPTSFAPPVDAVSHYNKWQIAFGILIGGLTAFGLHLKYKRTNWSSIKRPFILIAMASMILCAFLNWVFPMQWVQLTFLLVLIFSALSNLTYMLIKTKRLSNSGAAMAHLGFALLMIGILISAGKSDVISLNKLGVKYGETYDDKANYENILLYKNMPMEMGAYTITYLGDSVVGLNHYYKVDYYNEKESFRLYPYVQNNPKFGRSANPDTRHYWNKDVFTHVTSVSNTEINKEKIVSNKHQVKRGDSIFTSSSCIIIESVEAVSKHKMLKQGDIALKANVKVLTLQDTFYLEPICAIRTNQWINFPDTLKSIGLELAFIKIDPEKDLLSLKTTEWDPPKEFIIMKAIVFPYINVLWLGSIVMILGFGISLYKRIQKA
jgi:cytochrome c-type biogenesis protein CcmF